MIRKGRTSGDTAPHPRGPARDRPAPQDDRAAGQLTAYLHRHIPLAGAMQAAVQRVTAAEVVLRLPLAPNLNHRATAFGGSLAAAAILAAWTLLNARLERAGSAARLVIQRHRIDYERPVTGEFTAHAFLEPAADWERFVHTLARRRRARICVACEIVQAGAVAARFAGEFVALTHAPQAPD